MTLAQFELFIKYLAQELSNMGKAELAYAVMMALQNMKNTK